MLMQHCAINAKKYKLYTYNPIEGDFCEIVTNSKLSVSKNYNMSEAKTE